MAAIYSMLFLGKRAQKHVRVSANLYYPKLSGRNFGNFIVQQVVLPATFGILIIILLKIPYLGLYNYVDIYLLLTIIFFIAGLFYKHKSHGEITFKTRDKDGVKLERKTCGISYFPMFIMFLVLAIIRLGLMNGVSF